MARPASTVLTDAELRIMRVLWEHGDVTVAEVCDRLKPRPGRATIQTMLKILERKKYVRHHLDGRTFVYRALVDKKTAGGRALQKVLASFYSQAKGSLMLRLLSDCNLDVRELSELRRLIDQSDDA
ncbi:MAG: BlaI/MecI/CopY family transcriptional regulator [Candidatus Eremiobacteraeota bacterium]|nr:BlaI/MecI/CopY family transcriptional regulator [Candidatus Eremiobacteraeota bacterium]MBV9648312.1 BlaI/MecI/CopY family transcriptional regulator [Candidatus Eremiobacteraeota bacterium]